MQTILLSCADESRKKSEANKFSCFLRLSVAFWCEFCEFEVTLRRNMMFVSISINLCFLLRHFTCSLNPTETGFLADINRFTFSCNVMTHFIKLLLSFITFIAIKQQRFMCVHANWHFGTAPHCQTATLEEISDSWGFLNGLIPLVSSAEFHFFRLSPFCAIHCLSLAGAEFILWNLTHVNLIFLFSSSRFDIHSVAEKVLTFLTLAGAFLLSAALRKNLNLSKNLSCQVASAPLCRTQNPFTISTWQLVSQ